MGVNQREGREVGTIRLGQHRKIRTMGRPDPRRQRLKVEEGGSVNTLAQHLSTWAIGSETRYFSFEETESDKPIHTVEANEEKHDHPYPGRR